MMEIGGVGSQECQTAKIDRSYRAGAQEIFEKMCITSAAIPYHAAAGSNSREFSLSTADQLTAQSLRHFDVPAHFMFAYRRTGLPVTVENEASMSACDLRRWYAAMLEYFQIERAKKAGSASGVYTRPRENDRWRCSLPAGLPFERISRIFHAQPAGDGLRALQQAQPCQIAAASSNKWFIAEKGGSRTRTAVI